MDRLQAGDLKSYLAMQTPANFEGVTLIPKTDAAELDQLRDMAGTQGIGYELNDDDEFRDSLSEFGIDTGIEFARNEPQP